MRNCKPCHQQDRPSPKGSDIQSGGHMDNFHQQCILLPISLTAQRAKLQIRTHAFANKPPLPSSLFSSFQVRANPLQPRLPPHSSHTLNLHIRPERQRLNKHTSPCLSITHTTHQPVPYPKPKPSQQTTLQKPSIRGGGGGRKGSNSLA